MTDVVRPTSTAPPLLCATTPLCKDHHVANRRFFRHYLLSHADSPAPMCVSMGVEHSHRGSHRVAGGGMSLSIASLYMVKEIGCQAASCAYWDAYPWQHPQPRSIFIEPGSKVHKRRFSARHNVGCKQPLPVF